MILMPMCNFIGLLICGSGGKAGSIENFWKSANRSAVIFVVASALAGPFNYLYQIAASVQLSGEDFARLNGWLANLAMLYVFSGLLQFYSNFRPIAKPALTVALAIIHFLSVVFLVAILSKNAEPLNLVSAAAILFMVCAASWLTGQAQIRMHFMALSLSGLCLAVTRLGLALIPTSAGEPTIGKLIFANFAAYFGMLWILTWAVYADREKASVPERSAHWMGAVVLSIAGALIPQYDMFLMNHTQDAATFVDFSRASIFGRGLFAIVFLSAQWLLPNQLRGDRRLNHGHIWQAVAVLVVICGAVAWVSPFVASHLLRWDAAPAAQLVFLCGMELGLLAMVYLLIQNCCSQSQLRAPGLALLVLALEGALQMIFSWNASWFLLMAVAVQLILIVMLSPRRG